jgi:hypothetical protein
MRAIYSIAAIKRFNIELKSEMWLLKTDEMYPLPP